MADVKTPVRIKHNSDLADATVAKFKLTSRYPKVSEQLPTMSIEPGRVVRFGYNPSLIEDEGKLTMAYRYHDGDTLSTRLALAQLDFDGKVISNRSLAGDSVSMEDPKLFRHRGNLYISWVESTFPNMPIRSVVKYARLTDGAIETPIQPKIPGNDWESMQKNYVFFDWGDTLYCIYQRYPVQTIYRVDGEDIGPAIETEGLRWPWGEPRGGCPPMMLGEISSGGVRPFGGGLVSFFHSGLDNEYGPQRRRYFMGAIILQNSLESGFKPIAISREPILLGSEIDDVPVRDWSKCKHRKPQVVFPGSAVHRGDHWLVPVGVNDYQCLIVKVTAKDLKL